jgi:putative SOS response-associated peptidase YedK
MIVITTDADTMMVGLHDRMPDIVEPQHWPTWLGETEGDPATPKAEEQWG